MRISRICFGKTGKHAITAALLICITRALCKRGGAADQQPPYHPHFEETHGITATDQGSQYTSKAFMEFCESVHVRQSVSEVGCPYDNAPRERHFNPLENECINLLFIIIVTKMLGHYNSMVRRLSLKAFG